MVQFVKITAQMPLNHTALRALWLNSFTSIDFGKPLFHHILLDLALDVDTCNKTV